MKKSWFNGIPKHILPLDISENTQKVKIKQYKKKMSTKPTAHR